MFTEMTNPRQLPGDLPRKVFFTSEMELIVWYADQRWTDLYGFQLCFGDLSMDHVVTALPGQSVQFHRVDEGRRLDSSVLRANGAWPGARFWARYRTDLDSLPSEIRRVVAARLAELD